MNTAPGFGLLLVKTLLPYRLPTFLWALQSNIRIKSRARDSIMNTEYYVYTIYKNAVNTVSISDPIPLTIVTNRTSKSSLSLIVTEYRSEVVFAAATDGSNGSFPRADRESSCSSHPPWLLPFLPMPCASIVGMSSCTHISFQRKHFDHSL